MKHIFKLALISTLCMSFISPTIEASQIDSYLFSSSIYNENHLEIQPRIPAMFEYTKL